MTDFYKGTDNRVDEETGYSNFPDDECLAWVILEVCTAIGSKNVNSDDWYGFYEILSGQSAEKAYQEYIESGYF